MTGTDREALWKSWMLRSVSWWLDDAIRLLFGYDPEDPDNSEEQLALEGNDVVVRAGISARKAIAARKLLPINERIRTDNAVDYLVPRDDFILWAKSEFPEDGRQLHEVWQAYKKSRPKVGRRSTLDENKIEWQAEVDGIYVRQFQRTGRVPPHVSVCNEAANYLTGSAGTIRRHTVRRNKVWLDEQASSGKKSQN